MINLIATVALTDAGKASMTMRQQVFRLESNEDEQTSEMSSGNREALNKPASLNDPGTVIRCDRQNRLCR